MARERGALIRIYGKPGCIVSGNGTEFTSKAILNWANENGVEWHDIDPGKPQQNGVIESCNGRSAPGACPTRNRPLSTQRTILMNEGGNEGRLQGAVVGSGGQSFGGNGR